MSEQNNLLAWLNQDPLPEDLLPLPWDMNVTYMPTEVVRSKFDIMEEQFGAVVEQIDVTVGAVNTYDKDTLMWAGVKFIIHHSSFPSGKLTVCGTASFFKAQYASGWAYAQIAESLATTRAFGKKWKQFGRGLNKEIDGIKNMKAPTSTKKSDSVSKTMNNIK